MKNHKEDFFSKIIDVIDSVSFSDYEHYIKEDYNFQESNPYNPFTKNYYKGMNRLHLVLLNQFGIKKSFLYATFLEVKNAGGTIVKGAKAIDIIYYRKSYKDAESGKRVAEEAYTKMDAMERSGITVYMNAGTNKVFSFDDILGIDMESLGIKFQAEPAPFDNFQRNKDIEDFVLSSGCKINTAEVRTAYYNLTTDAVTMPPVGAFVDSCHYYGTLFHEMIHFTGNKLGRNMGSMGKDYDYEELVAETGAMLLGVEFSVYSKLKSSCAYLKDYLRSFEDSRETLLKAFSDATKGAGYLLDSGKRQNSQV